MSEYQYYEWQTMDRPLTGREQTEVDGLSSHMDTVTSTQAIVTYSWGDFKHDPKQILLRYFDAFLYDSNFGVRQLMFRLPKDLVDVALIEPYLVEDWIMLEQHGRYFVLHLQIDDPENSLDWVESESVLGQLTPLRDQLLQGDMRMLYLAWLKTASLNDPEEWEAEPEPPVPAGLKKLNASLQAFAEFLEIDPHLISAAALASIPAKPGSGDDLEAKLVKLTVEEKEAYLIKILRQEPGAVLSLKKHLASLSGEKRSSTSGSSRTVGELFELTRKTRVEAKREERREAERRKIERLEELARTEETAWNTVDQLLSQKRGKTYDEATKLLVELKDMAEYKHREGVFSRRFHLICERYGRSTALMERFRRAKLT